MRGIPDRCACSARGALDKGERNSGDLPQEGDDRQIREPGGSVRDAWQHLMPELVLDHPACLPPGEDQKADQAGRVGYQPFPPAMKDEQRHGQHRRELDEGSNGKAKRR